MNLGVIGGDGIGPEVTALALKAIQLATRGSGIEFLTTEYDLGARRYLATGEVLTEKDLEKLAQHDAILLGAIGDPKVPSGVLERGLLLKLRFSFDHYVNLRPTKLYPGVISPLAQPGEIDFVVVREGTEGAYVGDGGALRVGSAEEVANENSVNTRYGIERCVRYAFELAANRERKKLTLVHKHNVLIYAGSLWQRTVDEVAKEFPTVKVDYQHIDAATIYLVTDPERFDV
ncbi:MAG: 3-isopropylmalate dehydrogenase, partial [Microbacteriaceae bacterium]|nr:3-isopropylmalate dehydrogenase [Microbacteriaceae bacterium]